MVCSQLGETVKVCFNIDLTKIKRNDDGSVIVGNDELTRYDKLFGNTKLVTINGDFLLGLLTKIKE